MTLRNALLISSTLSGFAIKQQKPYLVKKEESLSALAGRMVDKNLCNLRIKLSA